MFCYYNSPTKANLLLESLTDLHINRLKFMSVFLCKTPDWKEVLCDQFSSFDTTSQLDFDLNLDEAIIKLMCFALNYAVAAINIIWKTWNKEKQSTVNATVHCIEAKFWLTELLGNISKACTVFEDKLFLFMSEPTWKIDFNTFPKVIYTQLSQLPLFQPSKWQDIMLLPL